MSKRDAGNEEEKKIPSLEELIAIVQQPGIKLWQEKRRRIKIQTPEGRVITIPYDDEVYARLKQAREEYKARAKKGTEQPQRMVVSDITLWNTVIARRRPLIESLIERVGWLQEALLDIGMNTLLFTFMISKEDDPDKMVETLVKIREKDKFVSYIMDKLLSLYLAAGDVNAVEELRYRIRELEAENAMLHDLLQKMKLANMDLSKKLDIALSVMSREQLERYARILTIKSLVPKSGVVSGGQQ